MAEKKEAVIDVPECLKDTAIELAAVSVMLDGYLNKRWGYKRAKRAAIERATSRAEFWEKLFDLLPELRDETLSLSCDYMEITIQEKKS